MEKFVIEDALYLFESIKENKMISYDDNLINSSNNKINNDKLAYIGKNIKSFDRLQSGLILPLNIQKFAQIDNNLKKETEKLTSNSYTDVTKNWIENANPNSHRVLTSGYFIFKQKKYKVDGKNVILDYSKKEKEVAEWLEDTFGGELYMLPRVNYPEGIKTADYLFRGEYWDLKEINGNGKTFSFMLLKIMKNNHIILYLTFQIQL